jgi:hypothetical protein
MNGEIVLSLIFNSAYLTYLIFMLLFLNKTKDNCNNMPHSDKKFRDVAVVITWIYIILIGLGVLGLLLALLGVKFTSYTRIQI